MAYNFLDKNFNSIGVLTNTGGQLNNYWGDQITHSIATSNDVLTSVSLSIDKSTKNIDTNGNQKEWNHTIQGLSFGIDGIGKNVDELNYVVYQDGDQGHYYLMTITQVDESLTTSGFHFKTIQGINSAAYDLSRKTLKPADFAIVPTGTQKTGSAQNILKYIFSDLGWDVRVIGNFPSIDYTITDSVSAQSVLQDVIRLFDAEVDAHVLINNISSGSNVFTGAGSIKRVFEFSTAIGNDNGDVVRLNRNLVSLTKTGARDSLYTKLYVTGNDIDIAPANNGANFIYDDDANMKYNSIGANSTPVQYLEGVINNSEIKNPQALLTWGKKQLKALNHPRYNYTVTSINGKNVHLGDDVVVQDLKASQPIILKSKIISKTISFADPQTDSFILGEFSPIVIPTKNNDSNNIVQLVNKANQVATKALNKSENTQKGLSDLTETVTQVQEQATQAVTSANGKNSNYYGRDEPVHPQEGDTWFWDDGADSGIRVFTNGKWVDSVDTQTQKRIDNAVDNAVNDAKLYTDNLNQHQLELTNSLATDVQKKADSLSASQQHLASQATSYVDNVFADVNSKAVDAKTTADGVYQAIYDPEIGINARVSTAEGNFEKIKSSVNGMINTTTSTADGLTREIKDRETGDSNTLQAGKDFATSQITSYDTGMQSRLSQVSDGIMAQVSAINLITDSSFINGIANWNKYGNGVWAVDGNNSYYGINFVSFYDFNHTDKYSYLTSQNVYTNTFPGNKIYAYVDVNVARTGGSDNDLVEVYIVQYDSSGKQLHWNSISSQIKWSTGGWKRYSQEIDIDTSATYFVLGYQAVGNVEAYIARPYAGVTQLTENGYIAGPNNNNRTNLSLFYNFFSLGIQSNTGALISGINGDDSGLNIVGKKITVSGDTTFIGNNFMDGAIIKNASIGSAQIADAAITNAKISNLDVNKLSGNISSFIQTNWNGKYGSTTIDANGMTVDTSGIKTKFGSYGMTLNMTGESVGGIGVQGLTGKPSNYQGLTFWLDGNAEYMAWAARNNGDTSGNPMLKLSWFRNNSVPPNAYAGFNFDDDVIFNEGINVPGVAKEKLGFSTKQFNGFNYPYFGDSRMEAGLAYGSDYTYLISGNTFYNLTRVIKALDNLGAVKIPSEIRSDGTVAKWFSVTL